MRLYMISCAAGSPIVFIQKFTQFSYNRNFQSSLKEFSRGGGQVVSMLDFYSNDLSSNPADVYNVSVKLYLKRMNINKKRPGPAHLKN